MRLFGAVAQSVVGAQILVVGTYRSTELRTDAQQVIAGLASIAERVDLYGLDAPDVRTLVARTARVAPHPSVEAAILALTNGNPLFVREVALELAGQGRLDRVLEPNARLPVPGEIRDVIRGRLAAVDYGDGLLVLASVIGRSFDVQLLCRLTERGSAEVIEALSDATARGVVAPDVTVIGRYSFTHELLRATIYDDVPAHVRPSLHARVASGLEAMHTADLEPHLADVAHHLYAGALIEDATHVAEIARRAGDRAARLLAFDDAATHYRRGLEVLEASGAPGRELRCDLLLLLGDAYRRAGRSEARLVLRRAADVARVAGDGTRFARAALRMQTGIGTVGTSPVVDHEFDGTPRGSTDPAAAGRR